MPRLPEHASQSRIHPPKRATGIGRQARTGVGRERFEIYFSWHYAANILVRDKRRNADRRIEHEFAECGAIKRIGKRGKNAANRERFRLGEERDPCRDAATGITLIAQGR